MCVEKGGKFLCLQKWAGIFLRKKEELGMVGAIGAVVVLGILFYVLYIYGYMVINAKRAVKFITSGKKIYVYKEGKNND